MYGHRRTIPPFYARNPGAGTRPDSGGCVGWLLGVLVVLFAVGAVQDLQMGLIILVAFVIAAATSAWGDRRRKRARRPPETRAELSEARTSQEPRWVSFARQNDAEWTGREPDSRTPSKADVRALHYNPILAAANKTIADFHRLGCVAEARRRVERAELAVKLRAEGRVAEARAVEGKTRADLAQNANLRWAIFERDGYQCVRCGSRRDLTVDHVVPVSRGGLNAPDNLRTLCRRCNSSKGAR
jgi:hypothetical protein